MPLETRLSPSERNRRNVAKRWAKPENRTSIRLDELTAPQRALVLALVKAAREQASDPEAA